MKATQSLKNIRKQRLTPKQRFTVIGGVKVQLMPVTAKGNLPLGLIKRIVREAKATRA
ncbi:MAG: hypothetical protein IPK32_09245 [Verrucomicrobiaceae bacterium]|nr:hypothetical protein [Verrucomicrobiaceae bacterium]